MSNELDKLKDAFAAEGKPLPSEESREAAIAVAMQAFAEENEINIQGSSTTDRLTNTDSSVFTKLFRRRSMNLNLPNLKPVMLGGASLAVLGVAIFNTQYLQQKLPLPMDLDVAEISAAAPPVSEDAQTLEHSKLKSVPRENGAYGIVAKLNVEGASSSTIVGGEIGAGHASQDREEFRPRISGKRNIAPLSKDGMASVTRGYGQVQSFSESIPANKPELQESAAGTKPSALADASSPPPSMARIATQAVFAEPQVAHRKRAGADMPNKQIYNDQGRDKFSDVKPNSLKLVNEEPVSTFSIDVDTASYAFMRASINNNVLPQKDAVRIEELINYFPYDYAAPQDKSEPFRAHVNVMPTPWNPMTKLVHIGIKGYELPQAEKPHSNLVFLIDSSGSMNAPNKLPLLRNSFKLLLSTLHPDDTIAIVTYAGSAGTVLEPTVVQDKQKIIAALDRLRSGGSTAGAEGIRQAYQLAEQNYTQSGISRVILATDGDFNVGITDNNELKSYIERKRHTGIFLSVLGFGMGNYNDELMQTLAQNGNGNAAYIDSLTEARKVLVEEAGATLFTIAKDVKIQIEFNPQTVSEYRLIGYETRLLNREDFNNDKIDAGDIGAGHTVTAIFEITPSNSTGRLVDELRYQRTDKARSVNQGAEYAYLKLRYKLPNSDTSTLITTPVTKSLEVGKIAAATREARFATAVAAFGQLLRGGRFTGSYSYDDVIELALGAKGEDKFGYRAEFISLVRLAKTAAALEQQQR